MQLPDMERILRRVWCQGCVAADVRGLSRLGDIFLETFEHLERNLNCVMTISSKICTPLCTSFFVSIFLSLSFCFHPIYLFLILFHFCINFFFSSPFYFTSLYCFLSGKFARIMYRVVEAILPIRIMGKPRCIVFCYWEIRMNNRSISVHEYCITFFVILCIREVY
jgi:hypothetical protein